MNLEIYPQIRCRSSLFAHNEAAADSTPVYTLTSPLNSCGYLWLSVPWTHPAGCYHLLYWWRAPQKPPFITRKLVHYPEIRLWFPVCSHREMLRLSGDGWRVVAAELQPSTRPTWGFMHIYSTGYILLYILQVISWPKCKTRQNKGTMNSSWAERHKPRVHVPEASLLWQSADGCQGDRTEAGSGLKVHEEASWRGIREEPSVTLTTCPLSSTVNWLRRSTRRSTPTGGNWGAAISKKSVWMFWM